MFNALLFANRKAEKPPSVQTHEQLGTAGIGALGNHHRGTDNFRLTHLGRSWIGISRPERG